MNNPNYHGFGDGEFNVAKIKLGQKKYEQFNAARVKTLRGEQIQPQQNQQNHPLKSATVQKNWSDETR